MYLLITYQQHYGKRIADHISQHKPVNWNIETIAMSPVLPVLIDDPAEFLSDRLMRADLVVGLCESEGAAQLIPSIAKKSGAKAVIIPIDNAQWITVGLKNQLKDEMTHLGITSVFPKTFCTLTETESSYGAEMETFENEFISEFGAYFGGPTLKLDIDKDTGILKQATVVRSSPCGSTYRVAQKLTGIHYSEALPHAGLHAHHFPCLSSMDIQPDGTTLMLIAGNVVNENVEQEIKRASGGEH
ncbi:DUF166 family protein [Chloroflexota bacterium]